VFTLFQTDLYSAHLMFHFMILGLPDTTVFIVGGALLLIVLILILWGLKFREVR
jgi:uncharacterized membrane protein